MQGIKPCPYCGSEVEMVKLPHDKKDIIKGDIFRIECRTCRALVARGRRFPNETLEDEEERIRQYEEANKDKTNAFFRVDVYHKTTFHSTDHY